MIKAQLLKATNHQGGCFFATKIVQVLG